MSPYVRVVFTPRVCAECGKEFVPLKGDQVVCSRPCGRARKSRNAREKRLALIEGKTCAICGKPFLPKRPSALCCSAACKKTRRLERAKARVRTFEPARFARRKGTKEDYEERACVECGVMFKPKRLTTKCCGHRCSVRRSHRLKKLSAPLIASEREEIDQMRRELGLRPVRRGMRPCMRCGKEFQSADLDHERMCPPCQRLAEVYFDPGYRHHAGVGGGY